MGDVSELLPGHRRCTTTHMPLGTSAAYASLAMHPSSSSPACPSPPGVTRTVRDLLDRALTELARGELETAPASSRTARLLADAHGARTLGMLARGALAIEEAMRGDIVAAERLTEEAQALGGEAPAAAAVVAALRAMIDVARSRSLVARGARRLALDAWTEARTAIGEAEATTAHGLARKIVELVAAVVAEHDLRDLWVVGPKSFFVDTPTGERIDLTRHPLPRRIWTTLLARHGTTGIVTTAELVRALWPEADPASTSIRNRLKVTVWRTRDLGLRSAIVQVDGGYSLAPGIRIRVWQPHDGRALIGKPG